MSGALEEKGEGFFDLNKIIPLDAHVTCTFDPNTPSEIFDLIGVKAADTMGGKDIVAEVPLWMLPTLSGHCNLVTPKAYNEGVQNVLASHAASAKLDQLHPDFYDVGTSLSHFLVDGTPLAKCLVDTFTQRIGTVVAPALQGLSRPGRCDALERRLFDIAAKSRATTQRWMSAPNKKKRKLILSKH